METSQQKTLYEVLSAPAPVGVPAGETQRTLAKETLDADDETLLQGVMIDE
jgi:hypothetical protein